MHKRHLKERWGQWVWSIPVIHTPNIWTIRNTTSTSQLGRGIRKVAFICGEIKDIVSDSDKHCAYLEDPDDPDLNNELGELDDDEAEELKREYAALFVFVIVEVWHLTA